MDNFRQPPGVDVTKTEEVDLVRQSSLLPGEVRTPTLVVTLSDAWGDVSGDWAAPGSSVWEEDAPSRHSTHTPLTGYGMEGDVWASATGSPLLGDEDDGVDGFANATEDAHQRHHHESPLPDAAELAAAALQALGPHAGGDALHADPHAPPSNRTAPMLSHPMQRGGALPMPSRMPVQPRYAQEARDPYESRFGAVHAAPASGPMRGMQGVVPSQHPPQPTQRPQNFFTVQEGGSRGRAPFNPSPASRTFSIPVLSANMNQGIGGGSGGGAGLYAAPGNAGMAFVPRLDDEEVSHSIIASAGLPLSMHSLVDYIRGGQPQGLPYVAVLGTTQNALRNYPNLNEPPSEEDSFNAAAGGARGGNRPAQPSYMQQQQQPQQQQGRWSQTSGAPAESTGFAVRGSDYSNGSQHTPSPAPSFGNSNNYHSPNGSESLGGGFVVSAGNGPTSQRVPPHTSLGGPMHPHGAAGGRHKSESEYLSDLLHFHANFFPPPPPPRVPKDERRNRAELWYHYASKWDITHRLPPPPRTPLPEMELEYRMRLQRMTRVPYHGDGWLQMGERWFDVTQTLFDFPEENVGDEVDFNVVLQQAVLS